MTSCLGLPKALGWSVGTAPATPTRTDMRTAPSRMGFQASCKRFISLLLVCSERWLVLGTSKDVSAAAYPLSGWALKVCYIIAQFLCNVNHGGKKTSRRFETIGRLFA